MRATFVASCGCTSETLTPARWTYPIQMRARGKRAERLPVSVEITKDTATPALQQVWDSLAPGRRKPLMAVLGREGERIYRAWFRGRNADSPNRRGFPRSNFWSKRIAGATAYDAARTTDTTATVVVADPAINAHVHGGTWGAKTAKNLALPLRAEAYGVRPKAGTIPGLRFIPNLRRGANVKGWLVTGQDAQTVYWWRLQRTVTVSRDPRALPPSAAVLDALTARALKFFHRPRPTS